ncbi:MAG: hypothetical protein CL858_16195 [Cupriavidus sp.]|uniref:hypothetical protein n=1 Tax=Cupriavidus TaxID=106589 RepID=UPI0002A258C7|nr:MULTISPECIES: hypothetical protein [Cupriavidus]EKZ97087.1 hypothetical protein D769_21919 [Cupriavidus sp. HMR-1]MBU66975.1 hypothetical protein [Cupriavidus sp.]MCA3184780.1 hypothetical protein [Cupriavidus sp.]MCA3193887.1 hypothetical protein [Cupriavidus sp.]MCA3198316.1 hypothetical protein [Cupriavidus sp.]
MQKTKFALSIVSAAALLALAACGGGGGDGTSNGGSNGGGSTPPTTTPTANDPYTGKPATGAMTNQITGSVVKGPTAGATVTAYVLNADASNGNAIGSAVTDASGAFRMSLTQAPSGMIRLIATGGTFSSEVDNSTQKLDTLELVAPYVTTDLTNFVITPVSDTASKRITYLVSKGGKALAEAYTTASSAVLQLFSGNNVIASTDRTRGGINYLSIVPGSAQDTLHTYQDVLTAIEYYGVRHDLPSRVTLRLLSASSITGVPSQLDANGQPITVGAWVGSTFNETQPVTLADISLAQPANDVLALVMAMNAVTACDSGDHTTFYQRYPLAQGQSDYLDATACNGYKSVVDTVQAKIPANNRNKYVG